MNDKPWGWAGGHPSLLVGLAPCDVGCKGLWIAVRAGRRWVPFLNLRGSSSVAGAQHRSGAWLLWDAGARAQHVLGSGKDLLPNGSCLLSPQQPPPVPMGGGRGGGDFSFGTMLMESSGSVSLR